jgi:hypothetical protein
VIYAWDVSVGIDPEPPEEEREAILAALARLGGDGAANRNSLPAWAVDSS